MRDGVSFVLAMCICFGANLKRKLSLQYWIAVSPLKGILDSHGGIGCKVTYEDPATPLCQFWLIVPCP